MISITEKEDILSFSRFFNSKKLCSSYICPQKPDKQVKPGGH